MHERIITVNGQGDYCYISFRNEKFFCRFFSNKKKPRYKNIAKYSYKRIRKDMPF